jgi:hypothetical protein
MTRRLATMCLMATGLIGVNSAYVQAQDFATRRATLKGIDAVSVIVEDLSDGAKLIGLTRETIQTDVELKLRLAGMRVTTQEESYTLPGMPSLYIRVTLTDHAEAASIEGQLWQNVKLDRNGQSAFGATTWSTILVTTHPHAQTIRENVKDVVDEFLNAWLSVNPKK